MRVGQKLRWRLIQLVSCVVELVTPGWLDWLVPLYIREEVVL